MIQSAQPLISSSNDHQQRVLLNRSLTSLNSLTSDLTMSQIVYVSEGQTRKKHRERKANLDADNDAFCKALDELEDACEALHQALTLGEGVNACLHHVNLKIETSRSVFHRRGQRRNEE
jgi:hypothetical protein